MSHRHGLVRRQCHADLHRDARIGNVLRDIDELSVVTLGLNYFFGFVPTTVSTFVGCLSRLT